MRYVHTELQNRFLGIPVVYDREFNRWIGHSLFFTAIGKTQFDVISILEKYLNKNVDKY